jgi:hypothetical protein
MNALRFVRETIWERRNSKGKKKHNVKLRRIHQTFNGFLASHLMKAE